MGEINDGASAPHESIIISPDVEDFLRTVVGANIDDRGVVEQWVVVLADALRRWIVGDHSSMLDLPPGFTFEGRPQAPVWWLWETHYIAIVEPQVRLENDLPELPWVPLAESIDPELWREQS